MRVRAHRLDRIAGRDRRVGRTVQDEDRAAVVGDDVVEVKAVELFEVGAPDGHGKLVDVGELERVGKRRLDFLGEVESGVEEDEPLDQAGLLRCHERRDGTALACAHQKDVVRVDVGQARDVVEHGIEVRLLGEDGHLEGIAVAFRLVSAAEVEAVHDVSAPCELGRVLVAALVVRAHAVRVDDGGIAFGPVVAARDVDDAEDVLAVVLDVELNLIEIRHEVPLSVKSSGLTITQRAGRLRDSSVSAHRDPGKALGVCAQQLFELGRRKAEVAKRLELGGGVPQREVRAEHHVVDAPHVDELL